jgi:hypothetical protein
MGNIPGQKEFEMVCFAEDVAFGSSVKGCLRVQDSRIIMSNTPSRRKNKQRSKILESCIV